MMRAEGSVSGAIYRLLKVAKRAPMATNELATEEDDDGRRAADSKLHGRSFLHCLTSLQKAWRNGKFAGASIENLTLAPAALPS